MKKIICFITLLLLSIPYVKASYIKVEKIPSGIISTKTVRGKVIQTELNYIYVNGEIAYCIEPGVNLGDSYIQSEDFLSVGIGEILKKEIELITYYGYEYEGHASPFYYAATQEYIWEKMGATNVSFTKDGQKLDIMPYKAEIYRRFIAHDTLPSFAGQSYNAKVGENMILEDKNKALEHFVTSDDHVKIKENKLYIQNDKEEKINIHFTQKKKQGKSLVYFAPSNQNVATFTLSDVYAKKFDLNLSFQKEKGKLTIQKVDSETGEPLENAQFKVYDEKGVVGKGKTDKNGLLVFEDLAYGNYRIEEEVSPKGYIKEEEIKNFAFTKENTKITIGNVKHNMPVTSDTDVKYKKASFLLSGMGAFLFYVFKKMV